MRQSTLAKLTAEQTLKLRSRRTGKVVQGRVFKTPEPDDTYLTMACTGSGFTSIHHYQEWEIVR